MSRCSKTKMLFDYLVGASQHRRRKVEADRPRGLEIYHQFEPGWLLDRKITRVCAAHALVNIGCGASPQIGTAGPITRASPPHHEFARFTDHRQSIRYGEATDLVA